MADRWIDGVTESNQKLVEILPGSRVKIMRLSSRVIPHGLMPVGGPVVASASAGSL